MVSTLNLNFSIENRLTQKKNEDSLQLLNLQTIDEEFFIVTRR